MAWGRWSAKSCSVNAIFYLLKEQNRNRHLLAQIPQILGIAVSAFKTREESARQKGEKSAKKPDSCQELMTVQPKQCVLVCQGRACSKAGAADVLAAFRDRALPAFPISIQHCFGQCGNGPMVLVLPEGIWYGGVRADEVPAIVERHLQGGQPVQAMLYRPMHPNA